MTRPRDAQIIESTWKSSSNTLSQSVNGNFAGTGRCEGGLHAANGERKYVNRAERSRILIAMEKLRPEPCLFGLLLAWTGARVSEILALSADSFQIEASVVSIVSLKKRGEISIRELPIPPALMKRLDHHYSLRRVQQTGDAFRRLWPWSRVTVWRIIRDTCHSVHIHGLRACPRGLRHGFGVGTLQSGVPLNLIQRWMGHARLRTTLIYASVLGPDEIPFARKFWHYCAGAAFTPRAVHAAQ